MMVGVSQQLSSALGHRIGRKLAVRRHVLMKWEPHAVAIDGRGGGENKMAKPDDPGGFQQIERTAHVHIEIKLRLLDRRPNPGNHAEMDHTIPTALRKNSPDRALR